MYVIYIKILKKKKKFIQINYTYIMIKFFVVLIFSVLKFFFGPSKIYQFFQLFVLTFTIFEDLFISWSWLCDICLWSFVPSVFLGNIFGSEYLTLHTCFTSWIKVNLLLVIFVNIEKFNGVSTSENPKKDLIYLIK